VYFPQWWAGLQAHVIPSQREIQFFGIFEKLPNASSDPDETKFVLLGEED
jgi:hypothetical protein